VQNLTNGDHSNIILRRV